MVTTPLWIVVHHGRGGGTWFVRARTREEALALVFGAESPEDEPIDVVELPNGDDPAILWEIAEPPTEE